MFTAVKFQYLGEPVRRGGRPKILEEHNANVIWHATDTVRGYNPRMWDMKIDAQLSVLFESTLPPIEENKVWIVNISEDKTYEVTKVIPATQDLGLDGSYQLYVKQVKTKD